MNANLRSLINLSSASDSTHAWRPGRVWLNAVPVVRDPGPLKMVEAASYLPGMEHVVLGNVDPG